MSPMTIELGVLRIFFDAQGVDLYGLALAAQIGGSAADPDESVYIIGIVLVCLFSRGELGFHLFRVSSGMAGGRSGLPSNETVWASRISSLPILSWLVWIWQAEKRTIRITNEWGWFFMRFMFRLPVFNMSMNPFRNRPIYMTRVYIANLTRTSLHEIR